MKFLVDEAFPAKGINILKSVLGGSHQFYIVGENDIPKGTSDIELFRLGKQLGIDAIITSDIKQVEGRDRVNERIACRDAGLHWIGVPRNPKARGRQVAQLQTAQLVAAFSPLLATMAQAPTPQAYLLRAGNTGNPCATGYPQEL